MIISAPVKSFSGTGSQPGAIVLTWSGPSFHLFLQAAHSIICAGNSLRSGLGKYLGIFISRDLNCSQALSLFAVGVV